MSVHIDLPPPALDAAPSLHGSMQVPTGAKAPAFDWSAAMSSAKLSIKPSELWLLLRTQMRPWSEFLQIANFRQPPTVSVQRLSDRLMVNGMHFRYNYALVSVVLMLYSLLTSPLLLIVMLASGYGQLRIRAAQHAVTVFGHPLNAFQQSIALALLTAPLLYLVGAGAVLFWVLGASAFVCGLHAVFYDAAAVRRLTGEEVGFLAAETV